MSSLWKNLVLLPALILFIAFSFVCQNLHAQNQTPNTTLQLNVDTSNVILRNSNDEFYSASNSSKVKVLSSFFSIVEFERKIGGDKIDSLVLIPTGIEPHDFESTINQIQTAKSADVLVYNGLGFGSWIGKINTNNKIDASGINTSNINNRIKIFDPHIWLYPVLVKKQIENILDGLNMIDLRNRVTSNENTTIFLIELDSLDNNLRNVLNQKI